MTQSQNYISIHLAIPNISLNDQVHCVNAMKCYREDYDQGGK